MRCVYLCVYEDKCLYVFLFLFCLSVCLFACCCGYGGSGGSGGCFRSLFQCIIGFYHFFTGHYWVTQTWSFLIIACFCFEFSEGDGVGCIGIGGGSNANHWHDVRFFIQFSPFFIYMQIRIMCISTIAAKTTSSFSIIPAYLFAIFHTCVCIRVNLQERVNEWMNEWIIIE